MALINRGNKMNKEYIFTGIAIFALISTAGFFVEFAARLIEQII